MEDSELKLKTIKAEKDIEEPVTLEYQSLLSDEELERIKKEGPEEVETSVPKTPYLTIRNVVAGIATFNFQGHRWHYFRFDIPVGIRPTRAVVSLSLLNISNRRHAVDMQYYIPGYSLSYLPGYVRVNGRVFVGDSDGYLNGLGYMCVCV